MKTMTTTADVQTVPRICTTGTVVCLAPGPSLTQADAEYCRGKATVMVINDAWRLAPWADVLYSSDQYWMPYHQWVPEFSGMKIALNQVSRIREARQHGVLTIRSTGDSGIEWEPTGVKSAKNSGGAGINVAVHLGATTIVLLGYDMTGTHFFGSHPRGLRHSDERAFALFRQCIGTMVQPLTARGITVVNCSRTTTLTCFPLKRLEDIL